VSYHCVGLRGRRATAAGRELARSLMKDCIDDRSPVKRLSGRTLGFAMLLGLLAPGQQESALAQAGSTGGTIGKQDKSISGGDDAADSRHAVPTSQHHGSASHSVATAPTGGPCSRIIGTWLWYNGVSVTVHSNSNKTTQSDGGTASVVCAEGDYTFTWFGVAKTEMTLHQTERGYPVQV
jgi:hypothetical protein